MDLGLHVSWVVWKSVKLGGCYCIFSQQPWWVAKDVVGTNCIFPSCFFDVSCFVLHVPLTPLACFFGLPLAWSLGLAIVVQHVFVACPQDISPFASN